MLKFLYNFSCVYCLFETGKWEINLIILYQHSKKKMLNKLHFVIVLFYSTLFFLGSTYDPLVFNKYKFINHPKCIQFNKFLIMFSRNFKDRF